MSFCVLSLNLAQFSQSQRSWENSLALYLPAEDEVTYHLGRVSQRLLFVREQLIYMTRLRAANSLRVWESTLRKYEEGCFDPRYAFFQQVYQCEAYQPYLHFILTGVRGADYLPAPARLPEMNHFGRRLKYLREQHLGLSRSELSAQLNLKPATLKQYEAGDRRPAIQFLQLCTQHELMHPYFLWLMFNHPSDEGLWQDNFELPAITNVENRVNFKESQDRLRAPAKQSFRLPQK